MRAANEGGDTVKPIPRTTSIWKLNNSKIFADLHIVPSRWVRIDPIQVSLKGVWNLSKIREDVGQRWKCSTLNIREITVSTLPYFMCSGFSYEVSFGLERLPTSLRKTKGFGLIYTGCKQVLRPSMSELGATSATQWCGTFLYIKGNNTGVTITELLDTKRKSFLKSQHYEAQTRPVIQLSLLNVQMLSLLYSPKLVGGEPLHEHVFSCFAWSISPHTCFKGLGVLELKPDNLVYKISAKELKLWVMTIWGFITVKHHWL